MHTQMHAPKLTHTQQPLSQFAAAISRRITGYIGSFAITEVRIPRTYWETRGTWQEISSRWLCIIFAVAALYILTGALPVAAATGTIDSTAINTIQQTDAQSPTSQLAVFMPMIDSGKVAVAMTAGNSHTCAVRGNSAYCWGLNGAGQLGDGTTSDRGTPTAVSGLSSGVTDISAGYDHTCAIVSGSVQCWGTNIYGELGDDTGINSSTPVNVSGLESNIVAVAAGYFHSCAVATNGVTCWGNNQFGRLGDGTGLSSLTPVTVTGITSGARAIVAGWGHTCALNSSGGVQCWGTNASGQLGDGTLLDRLAPVAVSGLSSGVIALSAGDSHTCALLSGGSVKCWGYNGSGQLGNNSIVNSSTPVAVIGLTSGVTAITSNYGHSCALLSNGTLKCWGYNETGQLGDSTITYQPVAINVAGIDAGTLTLAAGWGHTCVMTSTGAQCWGQNFNGQLGDNTTTFQPTPVDVVWE